MQVQLGTALPPTRVGVVFGHFVKAQLQVVIRAHPLGSVDGAFFQGLVNLATGDVLGHATNALNHFAGKTTNAEFGAFEVFERFDFLAEPTTHLGAGVAHGEVDDVVVAIEVAHQLHAIAFVHPGGHLAAVQTKGNGTTQGKGFVLAKVVIRRGVGHFNRAVLGGVHGAESGHDFASGVGGDLKLATGHLFDLGCKHVIDAEQSVQGFGEARGQAPTQSCLGAHSGRDASCQDAGNACVFNDGTTIHVVVSRK